MLMRNPGFLPLSPLHRTAITTRESNYFPSKFFFQNPFEKFWPNMEYRNKFFQLLEDGKILPQYGIILIGTSFQTLHAYTSWFGPN
jgi:hypothetical protein